MLKDTTIKSKIESKKIKAGIIGATGYTGYELTKILSKHKYVELVVLNSESSAGLKVKDLYNDFDLNLKYTGYSLDEIEKMNLDVIFLALPHTLAMDYVLKLKNNSKCKIIDLSADYRFKNASDYETAYKIQHKDKTTKAVYGSPELFKNEIKNAKIIANPGCYATGMLLSSYPIQNLASYIIFDCKSGWSGAGKNSSFAKDNSLIKDNLVAYNLTKHRHKYEVEQFIKTKLSFTPHVIDTFRGMMITGHFILKEKQDLESIKNIKKLFKEFYKDCPLVEIVDTIPDLHQVQNTNKLIIGGFEVDENNQMVIVCVLDNLLKGASGQAVQNMNLIFCFDEKEGLETNLEGLK